MAEMTITLRTNPETGKKDIVIKLRSDEDALPQEHEQMHRQLVEKLIEKGALGDGEAGNVVVERVDEEKTPEIPSGNVPQEQRQAQKSGG
jgi:hypothetical protein